LAGALKKSSPRQQSDQGITKLLKFNH